MLKSENFLNPKDRLFRITGAVDGSSDSPPIKVDPLCFRTVIELPFELIDKWKPIIKAVPQEYRKELENDK